METKDTPAGVHQLLAVVYAFVVWERGEARLVTEEGISASTLGMFLPQLDAVAKRTRIDQGPGLLVFDNYQDARQAAQTLATIAGRVAIREVVATDAPGDETWAGRDGTRYQAVPGGVSQVVK